MIWRHYVGVLVAISPWQQPKHGQELFFFLRGQSWTKSRFSLLFSHLSTRLLRMSTVAATFSGAYSRNKKAWKKKKVRCSSTSAQRNQCWGQHAEWCPCEFWIRGENSMWALTVWSLAVTDVRSETRQQTRGGEKKHAAPVCQRLGLWRLRLLFTFNRTFPCASAAERSQAQYSSVLKNDASALWDEFREELR